MKISEKGLELIKKYEGLRLSAYLCPKGKLTIGFGHTGMDVKMIGQKISVDEANSLLMQDIARFESSVNELVHVTLTQNQFDALVSFAFNLGANALKGSTLLKKLNTDDKHGALAEFIRWNKVGSMPYQGLTARREAEQELFHGGKLC